MDVFGLARKRQSARIRRRQERAGVAYGLEEQKRRVHTVQTSVDQCRGLRQLLIVILQDISKAFDSVSRGLKALAFGRLGLPDATCNMFATMDEGNQKIVPTAYGASEEVLGTAAGVSECYRGYAQGCTTFAAIGWTGTHDILLSPQNSIGVDSETFRAVGDEDGECDRPALAYAYEALYVCCGLCSNSP